ncbi:MAG: DUF1294 domain-containing protein [Enterovibrio sp.]
MLKGKVVEWNDSKGYGFIVEPRGKKKVFFHISRVQGASRRPKVGSKVEFALKKDEKGRYSATHVTILGFSVIPPTILFSVLYFVLASAAVFLFDGQKLLIAVYVVMSIATYQMYAIDKKTSQDGKWRIPENTLHIFSLFGGWLGALFAQNQLHHKSRKQPFKLILWVTIFANIAAFIWTFTL